MMNRYLTSKVSSQCCGCSACVARCPKHCIGMTTDQDGFYVPEILDADACINCALCSKVCPFENPKSNTATNLFYAAFTNDDNTISRCSSGGIFPELAKWFLDKGGKVYGAYLDENHKLFHIGIDKKSDLIKLQGSKYLQSDIKQTYQECKDELNKNRIVLYTGTPCQIQGLKRFLGKEFDNLYTLDVVCHGVPSPSVFEAYVKFLEKKHCAKLVDINFRDKKRNGWSITLRYTMEFSSGKRKDYYLISKLSEYFMAFLSGAISRESCYQCPFSSLERPGDITLGDFWGYQATRPELRHDAGLSLLLVNSQKGHHLIECCKEKGVTLNSVTEDSVKRSENKNLYYPTVRPIIRNKVYEELSQKGFEYIGVKYFRKSQTWQIKLRNTLPPIVFRIFDFIRGK